jgi:hypothetical protein
MDGEGLIECEARKTRADGTTVECIVTATPHLDGQGNLIGIVEDFRDITRKKQEELEKEYLIAKLQKALDEVRNLEGMLPICSWCKKIRDDKGYWNQIESYIAKRSNASFSHSICDECLKTHYPEHSTKILATVDEPNGTQGAQS